MVVDRVLCIEDSNEKFMDMFRFLRNQNISHIDWAINAEKALELVENSTKAGTNYDLIISDMHFDYFGEDDRNAGEKTMNLLRSKNYLIPFVFCSSQNWKIEESIRNIFYNPRRDWESEAVQLFHAIKNM